MGIVGIGLLLVTAASSHRTAESPIDDREANIRLDYRVVPFLDLYFEIRWQAQQDQELDEDHLLAPAVAMMKELERALEFSGWGVMEGHLDGVADGSELIARYGQLPERYRPRRGGPNAKEIELRRLAVDAAEQVAEIEPEWMQIAWPTRSRELERRARQLEQLLDDDAQDAVYTDVLESLEMDVHGLQVPMFLTTHAPWPGAFTYFGPGRKGLCFVSISDTTTSELAESAVHESIHALDLAAGDDSLLRTLERALIQAGLSPRDKSVHDASHTLFFLLAADAVRDHLVPDHLDYGDTEGYYDKVPQIIAIERPLWKRYRDGLVDGEILVGEIVAGLTERP